MLGTISVVVVTLAISGGPSTTLQHNSIGIFVLVVLLMLTSLTASSLGKNHLHTFLASATSPEQLLILEDFHKSKMQPSINQKEE